ncbi:hypothetical protein [Paraburkholderia sp. C35]|uniref:hypothetical protein n=1 Tax=Paraburkholderia sp. C35 TaxID=2126993 RepID=UPI000D685AD8|nr:hypothetical protein [Paraburkholderia sp. C35]
MPKSTADFRPRTKYGDRAEVVGWATDDPNTFKVIAEIVSDGKPTGLLFSGEGTSTPNAWAKVKAEALSSLYSGAGRELLMQKNPA